MNNIYYTNFSYDDGFGSQYQKIIQTYIYCKMNNLPFAYRPLKDVEHNYNNDQEYNNKLENVMNLKNNITIETHEIKEKYYSLPKLNTIDIKPLQGFNLNL